MSKKQQVVIVGGGGYGAQLARTLSTKLNGSKHELLLITPRDYYLHLPGSLRMITTSDGELEKSVLVPYDGLFNVSGGIGSVKHGRVTSVDEKQKTVMLESGENVGYDVLVLASGNIWEGGIQLPDSLNEAEAYINEWRDKFSKAGTIILVGGGAVGAELAGELRDVFPEKRITLIQGAPQLLNDAYPTKFRADLERRLKKRKIEVLVNTTADEIPASGTGHLQLKEGKTLEADLIVPTRGGRPNTSFLAPSFLTPTGHVKVTPTLQLVDSSNIFALGDITDIKEQKQVGKAGAYMGVLSENILAVLEGRQAKKEYKGMFEALFVTNGKSGGAGYVGVLWGLTFGDKVVAAVKSKGLFIDITRKSIGASLVKA